MKKIQKGFTLIELLIVIAIIGILASIVLVSLNTSKQHAKVAAIKSSLVSIKGQVSLCLNGGGNLNYGGSTDFICNIGHQTSATGTDAKWPDLSKECGSIAPRFVISNSSNTYRLRMSDTILPSGAHCPNLPSAGCGGGGTTPFKIDCSERGCIFDAACK